MREFPARQGSTIRIATFVISLVLLGTAAFGMRVILHDELTGIIIICVSLPVLIGSWLFSVRSYAIGERSRHIRRPLFTTRVPLKPPVSAELVEGLWRAVRAFGNGGLFAVAGWFWSRRIGWFRCWVSDSANTILIRMADKKYVISPQDTAAFLQEIASFTDDSD